VLARFIRQTRGIRGSLLQAAKVCGKITSYRAKILKVSIAEPTMRIRHLLCALCVLCGSSSAWAATDLELVAKLDTAVTKAVRFLASRQSPDGAWRSDVYAPFKEGDALTPLVMTALLPLPIDDDTHGPCERGQQYLAELSKRTFEKNAGLPSLAYPVYTAANTTIALHQNRRAEDAALRAKWVQALRDLQLTEATGWQQQDPEYGGWTYGHAAARKPAAGQTLGTLDQPNMSATAFAISALYAAGISNSDPQVRSGVAFVQRLRNPDGGFIFIRGDEVRNKAGRTPRWQSASHEFSSYGSATADGVRVLLLSGRGPQAIFGKNPHWRFPLVDHHPGAYAKDRSAARNATYYYYLSSLSRTLSRNPRSGEKTSIDHQESDGKVSVSLQAEFEIRNIPAEVVTALLERQRADGGWKNEIVDQREDDPLVATTFAMQALTACRGLLVEEAKDTLHQQQAGSVICHARDATCHGEKLRFEPQPQKNTLGYWANENDGASWQIAVETPGAFDVVVWQGCGGGQAGSELSIGVGNQSVTFVVEDTGHFQQFKKRSAGKLKLDAGPHELTLKCLHKAKGAVADIRQISLAPTTNE
jgi:hypothetical protein